MRTIHLKHEVCLSFLEIGMLTNQRSQFGLVTPLLVVLQSCFSELNTTGGEIDGSFA